VLFYFCVFASFFFCVNLRIANDFFRPWPAFIGCLSINSIQFNSLEIFFEIWIKSCWPCIGAHYWCFSDFSWFVRLHTLGTMVPQFAYWSTDSILHPYESHLPFTPVLTTRMIRALPRCPCRIYIADAQTGLQALNLLGTYNTRNEFFVSSLETCLLSKHFQWLGKKYISNLAYLKSY